MNNLRTKLLAALLAAALCLGLLGCQAQEEDTANGPAPEVQEPQAPQGTPTTETENLVKLCKVWGYTKYMHPAFLLGHKDWDEELLQLIPQVRELRTAEEVNALLHNWFVSLGEIDYETKAPFPAWASAKEEEKVVFTDTSWTADASYLGEELAADFAQFPEVLPNVNRAKAPARVVKSVLGSFEDAEEFFANEGQPEPRYEDAGFRLLGLFRLWNAVEYYFPYKDTLEQDWEDILRTYIPLMLAETDVEGYQSTIASMACTLRDPHVEICRSSGTGGQTPLYWTARRGPHNLPVPLLAAEGKLVVSGVAAGCPLEPGDVLVSINGEDIDTILEDCKQYICYPREDSALYRMHNAITASRKETIQVTVLRDSEEMALSVTSYGGIPYPRPKAAYEILEGNIGLINPALCTLKGTDAMMEALRDTDGLIVDLRQYPGDQGYGLFGMARYLGVQNTPFITRAVPSIAVPGTYLKETYVPISWRGTGAGAASYLYQKPVVALMDCAGTQSTAELTVQMLRLGENTVTMGENSAGAGGAIVYLNLPGNLEIRFSQQWCGPVNGEEWYLTGITPDIPVAHTIQGIKEGRDEVLEAAIEYIRNAQ